MYKKIKDFTHFTVLEAAKVKAMSPSAAKPLLMAVLARGLEARRRSAERAERPIAAIFI